MHNNESNRTFKKFVLTYQLLSIQRQNIHLSSAFVKVFADCVHAQIQKVLCRHWSLFLPRHS